MGLIAWDSGEWGCSKSNPSRWFFNEKGGDTRGGKNCDNMAPVTEGRATKKILSTDKGGHTEPVTALGY